MAQNELRASLTCHHLASPPRSCLKAIYTQRRGEWWGRRMEEHPIAKDIAREEGWNLGDQRRTEKRDRMSCWCSLRQCRIYHEAEDESCATTMEMESPRSMLWLTPGIVAYIFFLLFICFSAQFLWHSSRPRRCRLFLWWLILCKNDTIHVWICHFCFSMYISNFYLNFLGVVDICVVDFHDFF
jgi:hypothetical protein